MRLEFCCIANNGRRATRIPGLPLWKYEKLYIRADVVAENALSAIPEDVGFWVDFDGLTSYSYQVSTELGDGDGVRYIPYDLVQDNQWQRQRVSLAVKRDEHGNEKGWQEATGELAEGAYAISRYHVLRNQAERITGEVVLADSRGDAYLTPAEVDDLPDSPVSLLKATNNLKNNPTHAMQAAYQRLYTRVHG